MKGYLWEEGAENITGLKPLPPLELKCPFCGGELFPRRMKIKEIPGTSRCPSLGGYAQDMAFKCENCDSYWPFGPPVSAEHRERMQKIWGGLTYVPAEVWLERELLKYKLEVFGYC